MTNLYEIMFPDVRIEPATVHIPGYNTVLILSLWTDRTGQTVPVQTDVRLKAQLGPSLIDKADLHY